MLSRETQALMEAAVDAIVVIDHAGRISAANDATCRTFGYARDELLGANVAMLMPEPDRGEHVRYMADYQRTGAAKIIGIGRSVIAQRKDGSAFPVRLSVGRIPGTEPPQFVGFLRDTTREHEANAAIKLERDRANAYLELHDSILLSLDAERRVREINARGAQLLDAPARELLGRDWLDFARGDTERERARLLLAQALSLGQPRERELDSVDSAGAARRIHWRCIALRAADGSPAGWLCSGADVTDRVRRDAEARIAQDRLTRVARMATVGEMAAGVAHEINQPLTAITTYARACERYLEMPEPDFAELREALREIGAEGQRAGEIIRRLRHLVRNDTSERRRLDVSALIDDLGTLMFADARASDVNLRLDLPPTLPPIEADAAQIQQVILILVRNSLEALAELPAGERELEVIARAGESGGVEIHVIDNGPGISPAVADRLFDPFATTKQNGTGLGLATCRTILQSHGGSIVSRKTARGASFCVRLPVAEEATA
jgi:two-component system, LuxR family, sensor kinase FixL